MVYVNLRNNIRGKNLEDFLANMDGVQDTLALSAADIAVDADALLKDHHAEGIAHIEVLEGDVDRYVCLVDSNITNDETADSNSALSIEFGRAGYIDPETGEEWGAMEGLHILSEAAGLARIKGKRAAKKRRRKPKFVNGSWVN